MTGYKIKFNGIDRVYDDYSWRLTRRAKEVWESGNVLQGKYLKELERQIAKKYNVKPLQIFFFMIENRQIKGINTHSYGFNTARGREIKQQFKNIYYAI